MRVFGRNEAQSWSFINFNNCPIHDHIPQNYINHEQIQIYSAAVISNHTIIRHLNSMGPVPPDLVRSSLESTPPGKTSCNEAFASTRRIIKLPDKKPL